MNAQITINSLATLLFLNTAFFIWLASKQAHLSRMLPPVLFALLNLTPIFVLEVAIFYRWWQQN